ncbi:MAG TPA: antitoxin family protein [Gemmataceae bacterium]|jgi:predicted DNA-binding antitoxin AbrB/MazE fold protein|nr:antitoxin family protein [Gemmataceae bacterium]
MPRTLQAVYENGVLRPLEPVNLPDNEQVTVTIDEEASWLDQVHFALSPERWQAFNDALDAAPKEIPDLNSYGLMVKGTLRSATHAHGVFSFAELNQADIAQRFQGLVEAVSLARR